MIEYINKTVFNSGCEGLVNTINCDGVMGAGIALEFSLRYPEMLKQYEADCKNNKVKIGEILTYDVPDCLIINFPTKVHWKYPSNILWIEKGLDYLVNHYKEWNITSIAIPPLGCNNGGLDFEREVKPLIEKKLANIDILVKICIDPGIAEGKEKEMVNNYNNSDLKVICSLLNIKNKICKCLANNKDIKRFFEIKDIDGVGITTYRKLFDYYYNLHGNIYKQQSLFDL